MRTLPVRNLFQSVSNHWKQQVLWGHPRGNTGQSSRLLGGVKTTMSNDDITRIGTEDPRMSKIVKHRGVVYTSGQTDTEANDITGQTKNVLAKIDNLLQRAGTSKQRLLTAQIWLRDIERDFNSMNAVWCEWLDDQHKPVRATTQAPMARTNILVEIQVTAAEGKE